ncbi:MAG TPA: hypothetical protein DCE42_25045 [Myxococcales bacterium]|nr:hypothetical protein [Deltaproteobacteria bacterium]HAA58053.1 hypothetical protein [Myxococcales bacterium]
MKINTYPFQRVAGATKRGTNSCVFTLNVANQKVIFFWMDLECNRKRSPTQTPTSPRSSLDFLNGASYLFKKQKKNRCVQRFLWMLSPRECTRHKVNVANQEVTHRWPERIES